MLRVSYSVVSALWAEGANHHRSNHHPLRSAVLTGPLDCGFSFNKEKIKCLLIKTKRHLKLMFGMKVYLKSAYFKT